jgi:nitrogenase molybdenum-iron protein NifN
MAEVIRRNKPLSVSPLKTSQPLGATLAVLGLDRAIPLLHGAQGCAAFAKVFFVRHFREPIPLQTTALDPISSIMGADDSLLEGLRTVCEKHRPAVVGLLTTGLTETQGSDIRRVLGTFRERHPEFRAVRIVPVNTPDFSGGLESGFAAAVEAMIDEWVPPARSNHPGAFSAKASDHPGAARHLALAREGMTQHHARQVNVLCGPSLTPGDLEALKELIESFDLNPLLLPDPGDSLDGHLDAGEFSPLTTGGTPVAAFAALGNAVATLVVGAALYPAADRLVQRTATPLHRFDHLWGLEANDHLVMTLAGIAGRPVPPRLERQRAQLQDAMLDTHFLLGQARLAIAADPDLLHAACALGVEIGAEIATAVASCRAPVLERIPAARVHIGDLEDLEQLARRDKAELLLGNSHVAEVARRLNRPLLRLGFPLYDQIGACRRTWIGYRGSQQTLFDLANGLLGAHQQPVAPYYSQYSRKTGHRPPGAAA